MDLILVKNLAKIAPSPLYFKKYNQQNSTLAIKENLLYHFQKECCFGCFLVTDLLTLLNIERL